MDRQRTHVDLADEPMGEYQPINTANVDIGHVPTMSFRKYQDQAMKKSANANFISTLAVRASANSSIVLTKNNVIMKEGKTSSFTNNKYN